MLSKIHYINKKKQAFHHIIIMKSFPMRVRSRCWWQTFSVRFSNDRYSRKRFYCWICLGIQLGGKAFSIHQSVLGRATSCTCKYEIDIRNVDLYCLSHNCLEYRARDGLAFSTSKCIYRLCADCDFWSITFSQTLLLIIIIITKDKHNTFLLNVTYSERTEREIVVLKFSCYS